MGFGKNSGAMVNMALDGLAKRKLPEQLAAKRAARAVVDPSLQLQVGPATQVQPKERLSQQADLTEASIEFGVGMDDPARRRQLRL